MATLVSVGQDHSIIQLYNVHRAPLVRGDHASLDLSAAIVEMESSLRSPFPPYSSICGNQSRPVLLGV